jgi:hypothetical protein
MFGRQAWMTCGHDGGIGTVGSPDGWHRDIGPDWERYVGQCPAAIFLGLRGSILKTPARVRRRSELREVTAIGAQRCASAETMRKILKNRRDAKTCSTACRQRSYREREATRG